MTVVSTAGHVDHGKSSLVKALTGTDPDRFEEERRRGLTIDLGFAHATLPDGQVLSLVDVPGHVRFLRNMLAGVGAVESCLFVVAATEGWKPQSEEHLRIVDLLGIRSGVIALTKTDLVDDEWAQLQAMDIADRVAGTCLDGAPIVPVSSVTGAGLDHLRGELSTLLAANAGQGVGGTDRRSRPRLWVDRVFAAKGSGTVVTGTLTGGGLGVDQYVHVVPAGLTARIRGLQTHGQSLASVEAGHRVAVNLGGIGHDEVARGDALVVASQWRPTQRVDASLHVLAAIGHAVSRRGAYVAYVGSGEYPVRVRVLGTQSIAAGSDGLVRLHFSRALPLVAGDRFVLRESGREETVGGGVMLDVAPVRPASRARPDDTVGRVVAERGWVDVADLEAWTGVHRDADVGRWVVDPDRLRSDRSALLDRITHAGAAGLDVATLGERERALLALLADVHVDGGRARPAGVIDPWADHPVLAVLEAGGLMPAEPTGLPRDELRELVRRNLIVARDGIYWHPSAIRTVARCAVEMLSTRPDGFTISELREALGVSRKYALPLAAELDARGALRRRGDLRIAGPRLGDASA